MAVTPKVKSEVIEAVKEPSEYDKLRTRYVTFLKDVELWSRYNDRHVRVKCMDELASLGEWDQ